MNINLNKISDSGSGRTFVIVSEQQSYTDYALQLTETLSDGVRVVHFESSRITDTNWKELSALLLNSVRDLSIRQASFVGFGAACALVQNAYLRESKLVRTMVLIDGTCKPHTTFAASIIDKIEEILPLGLPLRATTKGFDSRSHLQRMRCPSLVVTSPDASESLRKEAHHINRAMPTSWYVALESSDTKETLSSLIREFQEVPAKCPQKNLRAN